MVGVRLLRVEAVVGPRDHVDGSLQEGMQRGIPYQLAIDIGPPAVQKRLPVLISRHHDHEKLLTSISIETLEKTATNVAPTREWQTSPLRTYSIRTAAVSLPGTVQVTRIETAVVRVEAWPHDRDRSAPGDAHCGGDTSVGVVGRAWFRR